MTHLPIVGYINPLVADALRDPTSGINVTQLRAERNGPVSAPLVLKADADAVIGILKLEITHKDENISTLKESLQSAQKERDAALGYVNSLQSALAEIQKGVEALNDPIEALEARTSRNTRAGEKA
ncbi:MULTISPECIES: hypothetical protein [Acetobacter]|uniref:Uncharacterized protein n=1 Tax=Acetobacter ascendens TaxID=481146 RepID=A0A1Y0UVS5_9PROT|nr:MULTISPECIES: hypothetical protein [Acetobacter]ARW10021.1 hypothetical protein S101447_00919 [Acetobacter ascendens]QHM91931.1 hypothetical protein FCN51_10445 [Acetobacter pasteurianus]